MEDEQHGARSRIYPGPNEIDIWITNVLMAPSNNSSPFIPMIVTSNKSSAESSSRDDYFKISLFPADTSLMRNFPIPLLFPPFSLRAHVSISRGFCLPERPSANFGILIKMRNTEEGCIRRQESFLSLNALLMHRGYETFTVSARCTRRSSLLNV